MGSIGGPVLPEGVSGDGRSSHMPYVDPAPPDDPLAGHRTRGCRSFGRTVYGPVRNHRPVPSRMIVELKAEHPRLNNSEISNIVYVRTDKRLGKHTPGRFLAEQVVPLKLSRLFEPYQEALDRREARETVIALVRSLRGRPPDRSSGRRSCAASAARRTEAPVGVGSRLAASIFASPSAARACRRRP